MADASIVSNAGAMLGKIAATRAITSELVEVSPANGWTLPKGDVLLRVEVGRPSHTDGGLDVAPVYVRVRLHTGDEYEAQASGATADQNAYVQRDHSGVLMVLPPITVAADGQSGDACAQAIRVAAGLAATRPVLEALMAMQATPVPLL